MTDRGWPSWDEEKTIEDRIEIAIQINGRVRERMVVPSGLSKGKLEEMVVADTRVLSLIGDRQVLKVIGVPDKLTNIVVK